MDFFISDIHFGHRNVIRFCNRPFSTVREMNEDIISRWNNIVTDKDRVFVLGDVFLCPIEEAKEYIGRLNGYKILIKGNHDLGKKIMLQSGFDEFYTSLDYEMPDGRKALLNHYPLPDCIIDDKYDLLIHGHIHVSESVRGKKINVSCDIWDYSPIPIETLQDLHTDNSCSNDSLTVTFDEDGMMRIEAYMDIEDFSGASAHIFNLMNSKNSNRRKK